MMVTLKSGKTVSIDLYQLSVSDIRDMLNSKKKDHEGDAILSKAVGLSVEELQALPFPDYRRITMKFWECVTDPLKDEDDVKNFQSASTSD
jgi:hypothetical protein